VQTLNTPAAQHLHELAEHEQSSSLSLSMPTIEKGPDVRENSIRFKNLLTRAERELEELDEGARQIKERLKPLRDLVYDDTFWQHQRQGLVVYQSNRLFDVVKLAHPPLELSYVADHFFIRPLAIDLARQSRSLVLAVSWSQARLFNLHQQSLEEIHDEHFPVKFDEVVLPPDAESQLQYHTQSSGAGSHRAMFHGHGDGEGEIKADRLRFLGEVDERLTKVQHARSLPLLVVGTAEVAGHLTSRSSLDFEQVVHASPDGLSDTQLFEFLKQQLGESIPQAGESGEVIESSIATRGGSWDAAEIMTASVMGRIDQLYVAPQQLVWGHWQPDTNELRVLEQRGEPREQSIELINLAALQTLRAGGEVREAQQDATQGKHGMAAVFRY
jgi:hypothetical protein